MPEDSSYQYESEEYDSDSQDEDVINARTKQGQISEHNEGSLAVCSEPKLPYFKSVSVVNSNDVHFGNKTVYKGPVTIKQIVYPSGEVITSECISGLEESQEKFDLNPINGIYNPAFVQNEKELPKAATSDDNVPPHVGYILTEKITKGYRCCCLPLQNHRCEAFVLFGSVIITVIIVFSVLFSKNISSRSTNSSISNIHEEDNEIVFDYFGGPSQPHRGLRMVRRREWLAQPPTGVVNNLTLPVSIVIITHSATESCKSQAECVFQTRTIQTFHIESHKWFDIGYNFLIGGDGAVYEGRGWTKEGAHTYSYNSISIGVSFIGTYTKEPPPSIMVDCFQKLMQKGVRLHYLTPDYKLLAHRQLIATESPGLAFYEVIKNWTHWSKNVT